MSQHYLTVGQYEIQIGWEPSIATFFASVHNRSMPEDESLILWVGMRPKELRTVEALEARLAPYCKLAPELQRQLEADMLHNFDYPILGYIFDEEGYHSGSIRLNSKEELDRFMLGPVSQARQENREVRITDVLDLMIYHFENGKLVLPS